MSSENVVIKGGVVRASDRKGIADLRVEVVATKSTDNNLSVFGETTTGRRGEFLFPLSKNQVEILRKNKSPISFRVYRGTSLIDDSSEQGIFWDIAHPSLQVTICIDLARGVTGKSNKNVFVVHGHVSDATGNGAPKLLVAAFDQAVNPHSKIKEGHAQATVLGTAFTNDEGCYLIQYDESNLAAPSQGAADLVVKAFATARMDTPLATSPLFLQALEEEVINLAMQSKGYSGRSEYAVVARKLQPLLKQKTFSKLVDADIALLAVRSGFEKEQVNLFVQAEKQSAETQIPAEWLYGLYRAGQPVSLMTLAVTASTDLEASFALAQTRNIISTQDKNTPQKLVEMLHALSLKAVNNVDTPALSDVRKLTDLAKLNAKDRQLFVTAYTSNTGPLHLFWETLSASGNITPERQQALRFAFDTYAISLNHLPLVDVINADKSIVGVRDLAAMDASGWQQYLRTKSIAAPSSIPGKNAKEQQSNYAMLLARLSEDAAPTAALAAAWGRDETMDKDVSLFFAKNRDFGFEHSGINDYLKQNPEALKGVGDKERTADNLRAVQNLFRVAPRFERFRVVKTLWQDGLRSAHAIKRIGQDKFVTVYAEKFGGKTQAQLLYMNAAKTTNMSLMTMMKYSWDANTVRPYVVPKYKLASDDASARATLAELFGNLDFCACKHCRSVYSPAAYLADLLMFLNNSTAKNGDTGLEKFFSRRPDIGNILLNCENTNTPMPYIDLVNEVLEDAILPRTYTAHTYSGTTLQAATVPQTTQTRAQILRAYPEYLNANVYSTRLNSATYPWSLPFNLWADEARVYLKQMGVARYELMQTLRGTVASPSLLDIAVESLGLLPLDRDLVTTSDNNAGQMKTLWGVKTGTVPSAITKVAKFIDSASISYDQLVQLLQCKFVRSAAIAGNVTITFDPEHPCSLDDATLENLTIDKLDKMHRFMRLAKRLAWDFFTLDRALTAFEKVTIDDDFLLKLSGVNALKNNLHVGIDTVLAWFANHVGTVPYKDSPALYTEIFLNSAVGDQKPEVRAALTLNATQSEISDTSKLLTAADYAPVVLSASGITSDELALIITSDLAGSNTLNLASLSHVYRVGSFCRALRLSVNEYYLLKGVTGIVPLTTPSSSATPDSAQQLIDARKTIGLSGLKLPSLVYLLRHDNTQPGNGQVSESAIAQRLSIIRQDLLAIYNENQMPAENLDIVLAQKLAGVVAAQDDVNLIMQVVAGTSPLTPVKQKQLIQDHLALFLNAADAKDKLVLPVNALGSDLLARQSYVLQPLLAYLLPRLNQHYLAQKLSESFTVPTAAAEALLEKVKNPADSSQTARIALTAESFVESTVPVTLVSFPTLFALYERLAKSGALLGKLMKQLDIAEGEAAYIVTQGPAVGWLDFNTLPLTLVTNTVQIATRFAQFALFVQAYDAARKVFLSDLTLAEFLTSANAGGATLASIKGSLAMASHWALADISTFVTNYGYSLSDVQRPAWIIQLTKAFTLLRKVGVNAAQAWSWNTATVGFDAAAQIRFACKSNYDNTKWLEIAPSLRDPIREKQRDALLAYVIFNKDFADADAVYEHYLIDVQMSAIGDSSRIVLANSSVQLFVQRVLMNLESGEIEFTRADEKQWKWRKNYRVWEAGRKVFLYAENWIWPELRDDKSPFYKDLESELSQMELTDHNVEKAYLHYLKKLDRVASLEVAGMFDDKERNILHVFARTGTQPHRYYYRKWLNKSVWTAWEFIDLDIEGDHLIPVVHNRRLFLFWTKFADKAVQPSGSSMAVSGTSVTPEDPERYLEIRLAWSQYDEGNWSPVQVSKDWLETSKNTYPISRNDLYFYASHLDDGTLLIRPRVIPATYLSELATQAAFYYNDVTDTVGRYFPPEDGRGPIGYVLYTLALMNTDAVLNKLPNGDNHNMQIVKTSQQTKLELFTYTSTNAEGTIDASTKKSEVVLNKAMEKFRVMVPHQYPTYDSQAPLFYADTKRRFFVVPEDVYAPIYYPWDFGFRAEDLEYPQDTIIPGLIYEADDYIENPLEIFGNPPESIFVEDTRGYYVGNVAEATVLDRRGLTDKRMDVTMIQTDSGKASFASGTNARVANGQRTTPGMMTMQSDELTAGMVAELNRPSLSASLRMATMEMRAETSAPVSLSMSLRTSASTRGVSTTNNASGAISGNSPLQRMTAAAEKSEVFQLAATTYDAGYFYGSMEYFTEWMWIGKKYRFLNFYHSYAPLMIKQVNRYGVEGLLAPTPDHGADWSKLRRQSVSTSYFKSTYDPAEVVDTHYPKEEFDFSYEGAYSQYNWELFFHVPLTVAERLMKDQKFDEAQKWFHYIFNPTETEGPAPKRFWKIKPFYEFDDETSLAKLLALLNSGDKSMEAQVEAWEDDPFNPHLIARMRPVVYMKAVVMKYLDNLIAWGDFLFRQDTMESLNEATQLYVLAGQILGRRPVMVEKSDVTAKTFNSLFPDMDKLSNALVSVESSLPWITSSGGVSSGESSVLDTMLYFCLPVNDKLLGYWTTVGDRLFKIRNGMNIEGVRRSLALFAPAIDPGMLVRARAAGLDLSSVLSDMGGPLPSYRFNHMLSRTIEFVTDVKLLGSALLGALERRDSEGLSLLQAGNHIALLSATRELRKSAIDEAKFSQQALEQHREIAAIRQQHFNNLDFMNPAEIIGISLQGLALIPQVAGLVTELLASAAALAPDVNIGASGFGGSPHVTVQWGSSNLERSAGHFTSFLFQTSATLNNGAAIAHAIANYQRRSEDWDLQKSVAAQEIKEIDKQILASEIKVAMAEIELTLQDLQVENAHSEETYLRSKFTNQDLYQWMVGEISTLYFQSYQLAYDLAKRTEKCFRHELAVVDSNYVQFGYWDSLKKGLLAGERLMKDLRRLESAYLEQNRRELELLKHVSLAQLSPMALAQLQQTGTCQFTVPEAWFDIDHPGHYLRRLKNVSITIPCVTGPYTTVSAKLSLLANRARTSSDASAGYVYTGLDDSRFLHNIIGIQSIATSTAQRDSGLFELNFRDERYLPFEGAGAISTWQLELPNEYRQFDYSIINDVILHLSYTARDAGEPLRTTVQADLTDSLNKIADILAASATGLTRIIPVSQQFSSAWHAFMYPTAAATKQELQVTLDKSLFAYMLRNRGLQVSSIECYLILENPEVYADGGLLAASFQKPDTTTVSGNLTVDPTMGGQPALAVPVSFALEDATPSAGIVLSVQTSAIGALAADLIEVRDGKNRLNPAAVKDVFLRVTYTIAT